MRFPKRNEKEGGPKHKKGSARLTMTEKGERGREWNQFGNDLPRNITVKDDVTTARRSAGAPRTNLVPRRVLELDKQHLSEHEHFL